MQLSRKKLYAILLIACLTGYSWLIVNLASAHIGNSNSMGVCLFKHTTSIPCPSCGSTRSILELLSGNFWTSVYINPLGILIAAIMLVLPLWLAFDVIFKKNTLLKYYYKIENVLKNPIIALPLIVLVILNWYWNISKGL